VSENDEPASLVGGRAIPPRTRWLYLAATLLYVAWAVLSRDVVPGVLAGIWVSIFGLSWFRPATRVDADGVRRPALGRDQRRLAWDQIDAIGRPSGFDTATTLLLTDGRLVRLADIPVARAAQVAAIGGKELRTVPLPTAPRSPAPPKRPSPAQTARDFERRTEALARDRDRMAADFARIHRRRRAHN
jgi:hypothetical protein